MKLKPFIKTNSKGTVAAGSLVFTYNKPSVGTWKDVSADAPPSIQSFPPWKVVTGGVAGDGRVFKDVNDDITTFTFVGPGDSLDEGWVYVKKYCAVETAFSIPYKWTSFDDTGGEEGVDYDWPVYWNSVQEPTGIPSDITPKVDYTPTSGTWNFTVPAGQWFAVGLYSEDSCCGRGFLETVIDFEPVGLPSFSLASTEFTTFGSGGGVTPNGTLGFTTDGLQSAAAELYAPNTFVGTKLTDIQTFFTDNGLLTNSTGYIFNVTWGAGSSISRGKVLLATSGTELLIAPIYTGNNNWQTPGQNNNTIQSVAGTFNFPATFSLYSPTTAQGAQWC